ncbi:Nup153 [Drosophila simulans]|uniref:Nup153 n=1 Tax=Drosophila simulans TaxID=7240 RepID=B4NUJ7_DROSI|nr:Nup153 [Drosophila simulans]
MEDAQEQRESSQAELAKKHPLTPLKELPEESEEEEEEDESSAGAQRETDSNNSIMGKMKKRVSSILPASLSGWFSPSSKDGNDALSSPANLRQSQPRQSNGRSTTKRKRGRRRIMLAEADADAADDLDDGSDAKGLNYEEVALADNIAEHDLAAEDEQTRRSEYNVFLLRKRAGAVAAAGGSVTETLCSTFTSSPDPPALQLCETTGACTGWLQLGPATSINNLINGSENRCIHFVGA